MDDIAHTQSNDGMLKNAARLGEEIAAPVASSSGVGEGEVYEEGGRHRNRPRENKRKSYSQAHFKVYKRRWVGLAQLVLLNIVVSWDVRINLHSVPLTSLQTASTGTLEAFKLTLCSG